jgi:tripartite-type tricarboxylate transporter receptor subunit TctC
MMARQYAKITMIAMTHFIRDAARIVFCAALIAAATHARADDYPARPVKIVVPNEAGGVYDTTARLLANEMSQKLGQSFYVENRPGGGSVLGTQFVAHATPDGYTVLLGGLSNIVFNAALYDRLSYDATHDFVAVSFVNSLSYVLVARKDLSDSDVKALIERARAHPDDITLAHPGIGSAPHILGAALMKTAGVKFLEVPYKGIQAPLTDIMAGRIDLMFASESAAIPFLRAGSIRGLAISGRQRSKELPDLPTLKEAGVDVAMQAWLGLFAPKQIPADVLARLRNGVRASMPAIKSKLASLGTEEMSLSDLETDALLKSEFEFWTNFIRNTGIHAK